MHIVVLFCSRRGSVEFESERAFMDWLGEVWEVDCAYEICTAEDGDRSQMFAVLVISSPGVDKHVHGRMCCVLCLNGLTVHPQSSI